MKKLTIFLLALLVIPLLSVPSIYGINFDFNKLSDKIMPYTATIEMKIEFSFGVHTNEQEERLLGTIVSEDGLVMFNGTTLGSEGAISSFTGFNVKATPTNIELTTMDGKTYDAEYIGVDRFTKIGFLKIISDEPTTFKFLKFVESSFSVGDWVALYSLLPDFVTPPLQGDVGMISANLESPEAFPLLVGFNMTQLTSVIFNKELEPVGVLGRLNDPSEASFDAGGMLESFSQLSVPLLGVVTADKLNKLIADPPVKGQVDRGWLGITLQALTDEMASFWGLDIGGGIIVNNIAANSPAKEAGLEVGDVIYEVNGQAVDVDNEDKIPIFQRMISDMGPETNVEFSIKRPVGEGNNFEDKKLIATLQEAPMAPTDAPEYENEDLEFKVRELVFADYLVFNQEPESFTGVIVSELKQGGLAEVEGLQLGDVIQRIGETDIQTIDDVEMSMEAAKEAQVKEIIYFVWRDNKTLFVNVKTDW